MENIIDRLTTAFGLLNIHGRCYVNSLIQLLISCPESIVDIGDVYPRLRELFLHQRDIRFIPYLEGVFDDKQEIEKGVATGGFSWIVFLMLCKRIPKLKKLFNTKISNFDILYAKEPHYRLSPPLMYLDKKSKVVSSNNFMVASVYDHMKRNLSIKTPPTVPGWTFTSIIYRCVYNRGGAIADHVVTIRKRGFSWIILNDLIYDTRPFDLKDIAFVLQRMIGDQTLRLVDYGVNMAMYMKNGYPSYDESIRLVDKVDKFLLYKSPNMSLSIDVKSLSKGSLTTIIKDKHYEKFIYHVDDIPLYFLDMFKDRTADEMKFIRKVYKIASDNMFGLKVVKTPKPIEKDAKYPIVTTKYKNGYFFDKNGKITDLIPQIGKIIQIYYKLAGNGIYFKNVNITDVYIYRKNPYIVNFSNVTTTPTSLDYKKVLQIFIKDKHVRDNIEYELQLAFNV
jgi:hypothetical protein